jgi:uncharacterized protein (TIGR03000 family)
MKSILFSVAAALALFYPGLASAWPGHGGGGHGGGGHGGGGHGGGFHGGGFHGGGFHGGGFHGGGFHSGGFHGGVAHGGFHHGGFHHGGFHHGGFHHGGFHNGGFHNGGFHRGFVGGWGYGLGLGYGYPYYGYSGYSSPYYGYSGYSYPYDDTYSYATPYVGSSYYYAPSTSYDVQPSDAYVAPSTTPSGFGAAAAATVEVRLPDANAEVWIDNDKMTTTGVDRVFRTAPFDSSRSYSYDVTARWSQDGRVVERTRTVTVRGGDRSVVDFTAAK